MYSIQCVELQVSELKVQNYFFFLGRSTPLEKGKSKCSASKGGELYDSVTKSGLLYSSMSSSCACQLKNNFNHQMACLTVF